MNQDGAAKSFQLPRGNEILFAKATARCIGNRKFHSTKSRRHSTPQAALKSIGFALVSLFAADSLTSCSQRTDRRSRIGKVLSLISTATAGDVRRQPAGAGSEQAGARKQRDGAPGR